MSHPKDRIPPLSRREFLRRAAMTGVAVPGLAAILAACGSDDGNAGGASGSSPTTAGLQLARPDDPVTLAITEDNPAIADGLSPEAGPLKIFGYNDYVWKKVRNQFSDRYGVDVEYTVFDTPDEMVSKMQSNGSDFDILVTVTLENVGKLAQGGLIQPLNKAYLPTFEDQLWTGIPDFYDVGRQYSAPYVVFTTGISWRNDMLDFDPSKMDQPWDAFWSKQAEKYRGKVAVLDDSREAPGMALMRRGVTDLNTENPELLHQAVADLKELNNKVGVKVSIADYETVPAGRVLLHQGWSGDMIAGVISYMPKGVKPDVLSYWYQTQGGPIFNDCICVAADAAKPVIAHRFLNYILDNKVAYDNFAGYVGYQPPINAIDGSKLFSDGILPKTLSQAVVTREAFANGNAYLTLSAKGLQLWDRTWASFHNG